MSYFNERHVAIAVYGILSSFQTMYGHVAAPWNDLPCTKQFEYCEAVNYCVANDIEQSTVTSFFTVLYKMFPFGNRTGNNILSCTPVERICVIQVRMALAYLVMQIGTTLDTGN